LLASPAVFADVCIEDIQVANPWDALSTDRWQSNCESVTRTDTSDPYNPKPALANYYTFTLDRDADVRIQLDPQYNNYSRRFNIIEGNSANGNIIFSNQYRTLETRLAAGTYTLETSYFYGNSFTYQVAFNDTAINNQCVQAITAGTPISDGWISACESTSRDIADPYNTIPGEGHRTKFFTFSLQDYTDIRIDVDSTVNTYIYILSGTGEFAVPYEDFNSETVITSLPQGDYTIEVTTHERYAPGQFSIELNTFSNAGGCSQDLVLGSMVSGSWSANCEIRSWLDENGDPYQGDGPERANYYRFTLTEAKEVRFRLAGQNDSNTIFSLYESGNYLNKLATTQASYWGNPASEFSIRLEPGNYELEVTKYNEVAIGNYTISSFVFENDDCVNPIVLGIAEEAYLASGCESLFRIVDGGMDDPYGAQAGTYYAKRFEFTLDAPSTIFMNANTNSQAGYLYLAKRINGELQRITETWPENYWSTTTSPSLYRTLDAGTYVLEVTSYYPEKEGPISANVRISSGTPCETFLALNNRTSSILGSNSSCRSEFKSSQYNYDPYGPNNGTQHFYATSYTFEIELAGTYNIVGSSFAFATDIRLIQGGDVKGLMITEQSNPGDNSISQYLEPGLYTAEVTSLVAGNTGSYSILVWDGSTDIDGGVDPNACIQTLSAEETTFSLAGTWTTACESESRSNRYAKFYDFTIVENAQGITTIDLTSTKDTYLYLLQWNGSSWGTYASDDDGGDGVNSRISRTLQAGQYRIEATTFSSFVQANFQLIINIGDADSDGVLDHLDAFPNDASEWLDSDGDGIGDNADIFPENANEWLDTDGDGIGNNADAFPEDTNEWLDSDGDGIGENSDIFPENASEWYDTDGDGIGNNADVDDDNDGVLDYLDALPLNSTAHLDSDFDGITDDLDDFPYPYAGDIRFAVKHLQVIENEDKALITIERIGEPFLDANIFFYTEDDSAVANKDYRPSSGELEFGAHVDTHTLEIELINNDTYSGDRSFFIKLAFPSTFVSNSQGIGTKVTISDDDQQPVAGIISFSATTLSVTESDLAVQVEITRSENALGEAAIAISTMDSTAFASSDYEALSEILIFSEGELSKSLSIPIIDNAIFENQETLFISLTSLTEGAITVDNTMKITILDDDILPEAGEISLVVDNMVIPEESDDIVFALQRSPDAVGEVKVNWKVEDNSAISDILVDSNSGTVLFEAGEIYKSISINLLKESSQFNGLTNNICINLSLGSAGAHLSDKQFCMTLQETDQPPEAGYIAFSGSSYQVVEGDTAIITLNRLFASTVTKDLPIHVHTESIKAKADLDFLGLNQEINLLTEETSTSITIETINDDVFEGTEHYLLSIENEGSIATVPIYILDDESEPSESGLFRFSSEQYTVNEDEGTVTIVIQRVLGFSGEILLAVNTEDGTAKASQDYNGDSKLLAFEDGEKSKTIEINIHTDSASYEEKSFSISLYSATNNLLLTPNTALVTINNTDLPNSDKDDEGVLGLGVLSQWWLLLMLLPICLVRIRRVEV
jgi:Calx-beta domain